MSNNIGFCVLMVIVVIQGIISLRLNNNLLRLMRILQKKGIL